MSDSGQHKPTFHASPGCGYEGGALVPTVGPEIHSDEQPSEDPSTVREALRQAVGNFIEKLAAVGDTKAIGQSVLILAYLTGKTSFRTKAELAAHMRVSPARISQILRAIPREFQSLAELKNRTKDELSL